jgi:uncharacterized membrane protein YphA (DoxX/SURF4 family)
MKTEQTRVAVVNAGPRVFTIGFLTVLLMVALRVAIGWHFFQEGLSHKNDPKWSSEGFLRQAKGPLAAQYKERLPGFHRWDELLIVPIDAPKSGKAADEAIAAGGAPAESDEDSAPTAKGKSAPAKTVFDNWYTQVAKDWESRAKQIENFYNFSDEQRKEVGVTLNKYGDNLRQLLAEYDTDITAYRHGLSRNIEMTARSGANDIPNIINRLASRTKNPTGEPGISDVKSTPAEWKADVQALENALEHDVAELATPEQRKLGTPPAAQSGLTLQKIDTIVIWTLMIGGACLVVGLFTRLSALVLALFLLSVMASQPPWIAEAVTTVFNYQLVEFLALLVLASSRVGRWAGLDFFIHYVFLRPFRST